MEREFWVDRWVEGQIGFHQDQINGYLTRHWRTLGAPTNAKVLVTLCGKSKDMLWLAEQGHKVTGVELSTIAVEAFFDENNIESSHFDIGKFNVTEGDGISLFCGDFFDFDQSLMAETKYIYDRASLIALPPAMREKYARHLISILPDDGVVLLITMEYPQQEMSGPPFSVSQDEVFQLYQQSFDIELLEAVDIIAENPQFQQRGLSQLVEKSYLMRRKSA